MNYLVLVYHGDEEGSSRRKLSELGEVQISALGRRLAALLRGLSIKMFSSPAWPATHSADILVERLGIPYEEREVLYASSEQEPRVEEVMTLIREHEADPSPQALVLVTSWEYLLEVSHRYHGGDTAIRQL